MPVCGRPKGGAWRLNILLGLLSFLGGVGCFDLSIPTVPPNPPPPALNVLAPKQGDTVTLTAEVAVQADSVNGVNSVSLLCGPLDGGARPVYAWPSAPYVALVDLSVCEGLTTPNPDGGSVSLLQLSVIAVSSAGAGSEEDFQVWLDATGPVISVTYPPSAQPKSPFTVVVNSNEPLGSLPAVTLAGAAADSVVSVPNVDGGTYIAFFRSTAGLGIDNYDGGSPIPIEVLTDTDQVVRLTVDATGLDGNTTVVDVSVDLSRLVWDRYIPGQPASSSPVTWAAEPVAFSGGLVLPLAITSVGGAGADWIPGVLAFADGTFYGFDVGVLPGGLDGGYVARGLNAEGQTLFFDFTGNGSSLLLAPPPPATGPVVTGALTGPQVSPPLTAVTAADGGPDLLCLQDTVATCSFPGTDSLTCLTPQLTVVTASGTTPNGSGPPDAGVVAGAGGGYLSPNVGVNSCDSSISSWNFANLTDGTFSFGPYQDPNGTARGCFIQSIIRLLAVGDGTFVVQLQSSCGVTAALPPEYPILRVGPGPANGASAILGAYTAPLGTPRTVQLEVVGVLADGRIVTLSNNPPYTDFELWSMNPTATDVPDVIAPVAGLYDSADATELSVVARSVYAGADGSFAVLLSGAPLGVGVMAFGPGLQPLWLYLYPRVTSTASARLVSAPTVGDVYLVDEFNNRAAALRVEVRDGGATVAAPFNLVYMTPAVYVEATQITPNVPTFSGGTPTSYVVAPPLPAGLQLDSTTGIISGTPTTVTAAAAFTVTATNSAGSASATITITVNAAVADAGPCTGLCLTVSPSAVQVVPGYSTPSITISVGGPATLTGNVTLAGTGPGGTLVGPTLVTLSPNPPPSVYLTQGVEYMPASFSASANVEAVPAAPVDVIVTATSPDGGLTNTTLFTIQVVANSITVSPASINNFPTNTKTQFMAVTEPPATGGVTWSVDEGTAGGTIDGTGLYTSPPTLGTYHIRATSVQYPGVYGEAVVQVTGG